FETTSEKYHTLQQYRICTPLQSKTDLVPSALVQHLDSMPPSSWRWTVQVLRFKLSNSSSLAEPVHKGGNAPVCTRSKSSGGGEELDARVDAQLFGGTGTSDDRIDQAGSGVVGRSSSKGFHQP
nr:hypothetical protein [Tanacetum cinerariifolium]